MLQHFSLAFVLLVFVLCGATSVTADDVVPIETVQVSESVYMLLGRGGNLAVSIGSDGTFVVDDQYATQYEVITQAINALSPVAAKFLINTHWHSDHSGGNEKMATAGAVIVAHNNVRQRLSTDQTIEFFNASRPASPQAARPIITFASDVTFHLNNDDVHIFHVANAHTDGDAVVHFRKSNIIHTGDVFFHGRYPFIDSGSGGSIAGMIIAVEKILSLCNEDTKVIPGHGRLTDRKAVEEYRDMLRAVQGAIAALIVAGSSVEQTVLAKPTAAYDDKWGGGFLKPDTFVKMIYADIQRSTLN